MAQELRQNLALSQQLIMTPQLRMAIKLLQLSRLELVEAMREEVQKNPLLELDDGSGTVTTPTDGEVKEKDVEAIPDESAALPEAEGEKIELPEEVVDKEYEKDKEIYEYLRDDDGYPSGFSYRGDDREETSFESFVSKKSTLTDHLCWQLKLTKFTQEEERIGEFIIGNLDEDGYLKIKLSEIASALDVNEETVERVLKRIQEFDPVGVAARDLSECLLAQVRLLPSYDPLVVEIIESHLESLQKKDYIGLSKRLGVSYDRVVEAVKTITSLEPKPGRAYNSDDVYYIVPDVFIEKVGDDFVVYLNDDGMPKLRLSHCYREMLKSDNTLNKDAKEYLKEKLKSALWFIKSIHQRQKTLYKVAVSIVDFQREFFEKGIEYLRPLVLKDVAEVVGVHESTVSRVTANKFAHTPQGIFELKFFFNKGFDRGGENVASEAIKDQIRRLIASEDPKNPYTDQAIVRILRRSNIDIARRTVAKYREMMGILSSSKRRKPF